MDVESKLGLEILREIARISSAPLNLDEILAQTIEVIKSKMNIDACSIYLMEQDHTDAPRLKLKASSGMPERAASRIYLEPGRGVTGWVAQNKSTLALSEALQDPRFVYFPEIEEEKFQSMLSVPLVEHDDCLGVINVHTLDLRHFSKTEITILETISAQIAGCLRNAMEFQKSQTLLREQTLLHDISNAVQLAQKLEQRIWILMTGITYGEVGGFNRALLLLLNEKENVLQGYMGLGPDSPEEAGQIWHRLEQEENRGLDKIVSNPDWDQYKHSSFHQFAQSLRISLDHKEHVLAKAAHQNMRLLIQDGQPESKASENFMESLGTDTFAVLPLAPHQEVRGVLLVDNRFNDNPITEANLRLLDRLASHLGWVIENSRLVNKLLESNRELLSTKELLIQSEKLAALGELSAEVAHEIKNPLVSIGGFARRLLDQLDPEQNQSSPGGKDKPLKYAKIILHEVQRMEGLLTNILQFSKPESLRLEPCDLNVLIIEVMDTFEMSAQDRNIDFDIGLWDAQKPVWIDRLKVKQVLTNLIFNAIESMPEGGQLRVRTFQEHPATSSATEMVSLCIEDSGGGIPQETFENIFNPFFTTKETGTGLGLSISRKIVESHGGTIHVQNKINQGVSVTVHLPLQKPVDYNKT